MNAFVAVLLKDEERSKTVLAVSAAVGGVAAVLVVIAAAWLK